MQHRLQSLRKKCPPFCHSERSEESLLLFSGLDRREIPRFARNDKINYFFRSLFSKRDLNLFERKSRKLKPVLLNS
jgi:hypothetical protein